jgi:hypothetical protein
MGNKSIRRERLGKVRLFWSFGMGAWDLFGILDLGFGFFRGKRRGE